MLHFDTITYTLTYTFADIMKNKFPLLEKFISSDLHINFEVHITEKFIYLLTIPDFAKKESYMLVILTIYELLIAHNHLELPNV